MRYFNTTGICYPKKHYMVDISNRLADIERRVDKGEYITINRGRQYGKTTTLYHLTNKLMENYVVFSISFEAMGETEFKTEDTLSYYFLERLRAETKFAKNINDYVKNAICNIVDQNADECQTWMKVKDSPV